MTPNTAWSLFAALVIAIGFLVGWCAGALDPVAQSQGAVATTVPNHRASVPGGRTAGDAQFRPAGSARSDSAAHPPQ